MAGPDGGARQVVDLVAVDGEVEMPTSTKRRRCGGGVSGASASGATACPLGEPEVVDLLSLEPDGWAWEHADGRGHDAVAGAPETIDLADADWPALWRKARSGGKRRKGADNRPYSDDGSIATMSLASAAPPAVLDEEKGNLMAENRKLQEQLQQLQKQLEGERSGKTLMPPPPSKWKVTDGTEQPLFKELLKQGENVDLVMMRGGDDAADLRTIVRRFEESSHLKRRHLVHVARVQNLKLWKKFQLLQEDINDKVPSGKTNTRQLWHGADLATLATICREGFDFRVSQPGGSLGQGAYFAKSSAYSDSYSAMHPHAAAGCSYISAGFNAATGGNGTRAMLLCLVHLGRVATGTQGLRKPPPGADSVSDSGRSIFAVFDNAQAYPEYIVHYRR